jgi:mannan endo-1,4-beta-mannosidase
MSFLFRNSAARSPGARAALGAAVGMSLAAVGVAVYLSPAGAGRSATPRASVKTVVRPVWPTPDARKRAWPKPIKSTAVVTLHPAPRTQIAVAKHAYPRAVVVTESTTSAQWAARTPPAVRTAKMLHCWDFTWQQDAQAAYVANLSDPGGLDGAAGPGNGDGLACQQLPVDDSRPRSKPIGGISPTPTTAPSKTQLLATSSTYYGVSNDVLPTDSRAFDELDSDVGKAPGLVQWFDTWDHAYGQDGVKVAQSWAHGAIPVLTWMPEPKGGTGNATLGDYTLDKIIGGDWDTYLYQWAAAVVQAGLPMVIRFAHEMNGSWYPWSAGRSAITAHRTPVELDNTPGKFREMWRHVWTVFRNVGADDYVLWAWTPVKTLCTTHDPAAHTGRCTDEYTTYAEDYPGDDYVDWVGLSSYAYGSRTAYSFAHTFKNSFANLARITRKPVYVAETGAAQRLTRPGAKAKTFATALDYTGYKVLWTQQTLREFLLQGQPGAARNYLNAGQRVIGFALFSNYVPKVHRVNHEYTETDWRWNSSPAAAAAFRAAVADPRYRGGRMPAVRLTSFQDPDAVRWPVIPVAAPSSSASAPGSATASTTPPPSTTSVPPTTPPPTTSTTPIPSPSPTYSSTAAEADASGGP